MSLIITTLNRFLPSDRAERIRLLGLLAAFMSTFALTFAYVSQYGFGLQPCILCLYQRWPYRLIIMLGLLVFALAYRRNPALSIPRVLLWLCVLAFIADAGIALFQVGVEQQWWQGTEKCVGASLAGLTAEEMLAKIKAAPVVRCDEVQFEFLGLSMAAYNGLFALGLGGLLALALRAPRN